MEGGAPKASFADVATGQASVSASPAPSVARGAALEELPSPERSTSLEVSAGTSRSLVRVAALDEVAEEREWGSVHMEVGDMVSALTTMLGSMRGIVAPIGQVLMACSRENSQLLAKETRWSEGLATQLAAAHQEVAELAPTTQEVTDLQVREKDARDNARKVEEKLVALIERARMDALEAERLWKERDDLLWAIEVLRTGTEPTCQERTNAQQQVSHLEELWRERDLKVAVEGVSIGFAVEVGQRQEEVQRLEAKVTQQRDEVCRLWVDVDSLDDKLRAEVVKSRGLEKELSEVKDTL
ncbi:uncharacterized protein [Miscanthus floridulus]|uniref:uncharacterized protein n=1 Tax=Miscanthus floridulus TaxID=154761 RepID=UPI0034592EE3